MAFSNIDGQSLGKYLQIAFSEGIRSQISADYRDWEFIQSNRVSDPEGREIRFFFQKSYGPSAVQYRNPNFSSNFPTAQQISTAEHTAVFKELDSTVEIEYNLWKRAQKSGNRRYAEPLAIEIESKVRAVKRQLAKDLYGDGTGVLGTLSVGAVVEGGNVRFQLDTSSGARGHVGWFEFDEICVIKANAGTASSLVTDVADTYFKVLSRRRADNTVLMKALDSSFNELTVTTITTPETAGDVLYKFEQPTFANLSSPGDYGSTTEVFPGLESLTANDGRLVHGITMEGATAGTHFDASGTPIDVSHIESLMNDLKINVGEGAYSWKMANMAPEVYSTFVESRETDRRFNSIQDETRGLRKFVYQHRQDAIELNASEYCPKTKIYVLPEAKQGQGKVIESYWTDMEPVRVNDSGEFHLKPGADGGHERRITTYLEGYGTMICKHPAACGVLKNFIIS